MFSDLILVNVHQINLAKKIGLGAGGGGLHPGNRGRGADEVRLRLGAAAEDVVPVVASGRLALVRERLRTRNRRPW